ncbi:hypothetical protein L195_g004487 [Trifolium pratense]|uniref:Uncharacterized protein n=1 Tax=Trifolium pratense TaxID=57577 RepID=A0A2K3NY68_TRIPR|nr:hypothetical protein L195_g004487 [Trifolium pratense]
MKHRNSSNFLHISTVKHCHVVPKQSSACSRPIGYGVIGIRLHPTDHRVRHNTISSWAAAAGLSPMDILCNTDASVSCNSSLVVSATDSLVATRILPCAAWTLTLALLNRIPHLANQIV